MLARIRALFAGRGSPTRLGLSDLSGYEGQLIRGFETAASVRRAGFAALEHATGLVGRSLAVATVTGTDLLTPSVLRDIGRDLILRGESFHVFDVPRGRGAPSLLRATTATVYGAPEPHSWRYSLTVNGPTDTRTRIYSAGEVLHVRYATPPETPWQGISPLHSAALTGTLAAQLEASLGEEAAVAVLRYLIAPTGWDQTKMDELANRMRSGLEAPRKVTVVETTKQAGGLGQSSAPSQDLVPQKLGPAPAEAAVNLYGTIYGAVLGACGIPSALSGMQGSTGGALLREGARLLKTHTLLPLAKLIAAEASRVLEVAVAITVNELDTPDITAKARAVKMLTEAGIPIADARAAVGLGGQVGP